MVAVGTGVGGALVLDGRTRRGAHHVAGEIGHVPVPGAQGEPCTCGRTGHLEGVTAGPQIHRRYLAKGGDPEVPDAREVERCADAGDVIAQEVYRDSAVCLARALAGLVTVIDPDVVVERMLTRGRADDTEDDAEPRFVQATQRTLESGHLGQHR